MTVREITFNATLWANGNVPSGFGSNGKDAFSVVLDADGTTCWAFEYQGAGFARFNLSDGSFVHQGALGGVPGNAGPFTLDTRTGVANDSGSIFWSQDNAGHYFTAYNNNHIAKFHIASGPGGNLLDGYCVVDATYNFTGGHLHDMCVWENSGTHYLSWIADNGVIFVLNADTMALVGDYTPSPLNKGWRVFVDTSNVLWGVFSDSSADSTLLVRWNPPDGETGGTLNVTTHAITDATLNTSNTFPAPAPLATYIPANNSVLLGNNGNEFTGDVATIDLTAFTRVAAHADDGTFFFSFPFDGQESPLFLGVQSGGSLAIQGELGTLGTPNPNQLGGILNVINPLALSLTSTLNVTTTINAASPTDPVPTQDWTGVGLSATCFPPCAAMQYNGNYLVVSYDPTQATLGATVLNGSPVYIITLIATHQISGTTTVAGSLVSYSGTSSGSVVADGSGNYAITGLIDGTYTITPSLSPWTFSPTSRNVTVSGADVPNVNFTATFPPPGHVFIPLPFSKRLTAAAAVFAVIEIASPIGAPTLTSDVPTRIALQLEYAQLNVVYTQLSHQPTANNQADLYGAIDSAVTIVGNLNTTIQSMTASGDSGVVLNGMKTVVANSLTQLRKVQNDEGLHPGPGQML